MPGSCCVRTADSRGIKGRMQNFLQPPAVSCGYDSGTATALASETPATRREFSKIEIAFGVPLIRVFACWGLYWGLPILGNYHMLLSYCCYTEMNHDLNA